MLNSSVLKTGVIFLLGILLSEVSGMAFAKNFVGSLDNYNWSGWLLYDNHFTQNTREEVLHDSGDSSFNNEENQTTLDGYVFDADRNDSLNNEEGYTLDNETGYVLQELAESTNEEVSSTFDANNEKDSPVDFMDSVFTNEGYTLCDPSFFEKEIPLR